MRIRPATVADAEPIRHIYNHEVMTSTVTFDLVERTVEEQRRWLTDRSGAHAVVVAEIDERVVAFGSLSPYRDRPAYNTTVEDSVYVDPQARSGGIGSAVLTEIVATAERHGFHSVMARIVGGHEASMALHRNLGFEVIGTEREVGRKFGRWLDVVLMQKLL